MATLKGFKVTNREQFDTLQTVTNREQFDTLQTVIIAASTTPPTFQALNISERWSLTATDVSDIVTFSNHHSLEHLTIAFNDPSTIRRFFTSPPTTIKTLIIQLDRLFHCGEALTICPNNGPPKPMVSVESLDLNAWRNAIEEDSDRSWGMLLRLFPNLLHLDVSMGPANIPFVGGEAMKVVAECCPKLRSIRGGGVGELTAVDVDRFMMGVPDLSSISLEFRDCEGWNDPVIADRGWWNRIRSFEVITLDYMEVELEDILSFIDRLGKSVESLEFEVNEETVMPIVQRITEKCKKIMYLHLSKANDMEAAYRNAVGWLLRNKPPTLKSVMWYLKSQDEEDNIEEEEMKEIEALHDLAEEVGVSFELWGSNWNPPEFVEVK
ncbi:hypothetical protein HDU67_005055 [Dinochytrium kinnereticum]|nr:hypothetical protein HDU67_005055 [Dinochytrium kinnereticum]